MRSRRTVGVLLALVCGLSLASCAGVPRTSAPQVIRTVDAGGDQGSGHDIAPEPGANPRSIVSGFLQASGVAASGHSAARQFLTAEARRRWQDSTTIVVDDVRVQVPAIAGDTASVIVTGRRVGQLDARGIYSPKLEGVGLGSLESFPFKMRQVSGEWRIDDLQTGVLIRRADFDVAYRPRPLYFFDLTETHLVTDLRYSALEGQQLANWLLQQMITGPRPELVAAVVNEIPEQLDSRRVTATFADQIKIEMPGSSGIESSSLRRLAAQLAYTFGLIQFASTVQLTDGGTPVPIPNLGDAFSASDFDATIGGDAIASGVVYFVRGGALLDAMGKPVPGRLGTAQYGIESAAIRPSADGGARVIAVGRGIVMLGAFSAGLIAVKLGANEVSRPAWQPYSDDGWIGTNKGLYRIPPSGVARKVPVSTGRGPLPAGVIRAVRFSPDGVRVAFVLDASDGTSAVWVGTVVRAGGDARIDNAEPVTPPGLLVNDVDWSNPTALVFVARQAGGGDGDSSLWVLQSDGSGLHAQNGPSGLPAAPQLVTSAPGQFTVVSAGGSIWVQRADSWASLDGSGNTQGQDPVYPE